MRIIYFDTETTGLKSADKICSLCFVSNDGLNKTFLFNPEREVCEEASRVNGFTWDALKKYPTFKECATEVKAILDSADILVAHNAEFDRGMLYQEFHRVGIEWNPSNIECTMLKAKSMIQGCRYSLDALTEHLGLKNLREDTHGADIDTMMCKALHEKLCSMEPEFSLEKMNEDKREVIQAMKEGLVELTFIKNDGSTRNAVATLKEDLVTGKHFFTHNWSCVDFYEPEISDWRVFNLHRLISWKKVS